jgi:asparagine synthase (glutamine-hydrolysing)
VCGIVGFYDVKNGEVEHHLLKAMTNVLCHRGPDGEGFYHDGPVALGHRRLSIIDLKGGNQPMSNEDGTIWITYNGEVYNFQEIRMGLEKKGHRFKTRSDTEVIVHAYEEYGANCLSILRGMFAFGIWDSRKRRLFVARDRIGKKPLYYYFDGHRFIFASEIKAILQDRSVKREIDYDALIDYFVYHYIPFPQSIFRNIRKLPPAHFMWVCLKKNILDSLSGCESERPGLEIQQSPSGIPRKWVTESVGSSSTVSGYSSDELKLEIERYWDLEFSPDYTLSEDEWAEGLEEKIKESVRIRLISEVPLGAFLSGGIDSSSVVALMASVSGDPPKTFSIAFKESGFNEVGYARVIAEKFGTDHHEFLVTPDATEVLEKLTWAFDEPFADSSAIPTYYVSKMARQMVTVILSGDGGDEAFAGYDRYSVARLFGKLDFVPLRIRRALFSQLSALLPMGMKGKGLLMNLSHAPFERAVGSRTFDGPGYLEEMISREVQEKVLGRRNQLNHGYSFLRKFYDTYPNSEDITRLQYEDIKGYLAEDIMAKVDRASMICSLETRAPLLDHVMLEFAARIPAKILMKNGEKKYVLKKAMEKYVPNAILNRKKKGFEVPLEHWFKKELREFAWSVLLSEKSRERGFFNSKFIEKMLDAHTQKGRNLSSQIWALVFFECWCRNWLDSTG